MSRDEIKAEFAASVSGAWLDLIVNRRDGSELTHSLKRAMNLSDKLCDELAEKLWTAFKAARDAEPKPAQNGPLPQKATVQK